MLMLLLFLCIFLNPFNLSPLVLTSTLFPSGSFHWKSWAPFHAHILLAPFHPWQSSPCSFTLLEIRKVEGVSFSFSVTYKDFGTFVIMRNNSCKIQNMGVDICVVLDPEGLFRFPVPEAPASKWNKNHRKLERAWRWYRVSFKISKRFTLKQNNFIIRMSSSTFSSGI